MHYLKERAMKQRQVVAADAGISSVGECIPPDQRLTRVPLGYPLSPEQLDNVHGGAIYIPSSLFDIAREVGNWSIEYLLDPDNYK
jgi:hypothetical protein